MVRVLTVIQRTTLYMLHIRLELKSADGVAECATSTGTVPRGRIKTNEYITLPVMFLIRETAVWAACT